MKTFSISYSRILNFPASKLTTAGTKSPSPGGSNIFISGSCGMIAVTIQRRQGLWTWWCSSIALIPTGFSNQDLVSALRTKFKFNLHTKVCWVRAESIIKIEIRQHNFNIALSFLNSCLFQDRIVSICSNLA